MNRNNKDFRLNEGNKYSTPNDLEPTRFFADVEFGMPSKQCINFGICRIDPTSETSEKISKVHCDKPSIFNAEISYYDSSRFEMTLLKDQLDISCRKKYFSTKYFRVDEYFSTSFQLKDLEKIFMEIKKGRYLIAKTNKTYTIIFS